MLFEMLKMADAEPRVAIIPVDAELAPDMGLVRQWRLRVEAMIAGEHLDLVATPPQRVGDGGAAEFITANVKRGVEIGEGENAHGWCVMMNLSPLPRRESFPSSAGQEPIPPNWGDHGNKRMTP